MARRTSSTKKKPAPAALDPSLTLDTIGPGYHAVMLHGERIGDIRGLEAGTPGLAEQIGHGHKTRTDAANAILRRYLTRPVPASCRWCRTEENTFLLTNNHGGAHGIHWGHCMAQALRRNHVAYALAHDDLDRTQEYIDRAADLWVHHPDSGWLDDARAALDARRDRQRPPKHADVLVASEEAALW